MSKISVNYKHALSYHFLAPKEIGDSLAAPGSSKGDAGYPNNNLYSYIFKNEVLKNVTRHKQKGTLKCMYGT